MRPSLAPPRLPMRMQPPHHNNPPPRVLGYTASARTLTAHPSLPGLSAFLETRKCVHGSSQHPYQPHRQHQQQRYHQQQQQRHHDQQRREQRQQYCQRRQRRYYSRELSYDYSYEYEEDDEYDDRFQRYSRLPSLRSAPGTLTFVNLLVKRVLCFFTCTPCGLHGAA